MTTPDYAHLPLLTNKQGEKLGKSAKAAAIDTLPPQDVWKTIFNALGLSPEDSLLSESPSTILQWAAGEWDLLQVSAEDKITE
jgi:glutamyl-Q tRNA(Asp) synthetase